MFGIKRLLKHELDSIIGVNMTTREYLEIFSLYNYEKNCLKDNEGYYKEINNIKIYVEAYKTSTLCLYFEKEGQKYFYIQ